MIRHIGITGVYERTGKAKQRQRYWFHRPGNALIVLAGLRHWQQVPGGLQASLRDYYHPSECRDGADS